MKKQNHTGKKGRKRKSFKLINYYGEMKKEEKSKA